MKLEYFEDGKIRTIEADKVFTGMLDAKGNKLYTGDSIVFKKSNLRETAFTVDFNEGEFGIWWPVGIEDKRTWASLRSLSFLGIEVG